jgi:hypothetical protein
MFGVDERRDVSKEGRECADEVGSRIVRMEHIGAKFAKPSREPGNGDPRSAIRKIQRVDLYGYLREVLGQGTSLPEADHAHHDARPVGDPDEVIDDLFETARVERRDKVNDFDRINIRRSPVRR